MKSRPSLEVTGTYTLLVGSYTSAGYGGVGNEPYNAVVDKLACVFVCMPVGKCRTEGEVSPADFESLASLSRDSRSPVQMRNNVDCLGLRILPDKFIDLGRRPYFGW